MSLKRGDQGFVTDEKESRLLWILQESRGFTGYLRGLLGLYKTSVGGLEVG